jgi:hypothetical protein
MILGIIYDLNRNNSYIKFLIISYHLYELSIIIKNLIYIIFKFFYKIL